MPSGGSSNAIKANFREGLSVLEYFSSTHGARKGSGRHRPQDRRQPDTSRASSPTWQERHINEIDCKTANGVTKTTIYKAKPLKSNSKDMIIGRTARDIVRKPDHR